jgi:hypothetical protein
VTGRSGGLLEAMMPIVGPPPVMGHCDDYDHLLFQVVQKTVGIPKKTSPSNLSSHTRTRLRMSGKKASRLLDVKEEFAGDPRGPLSVVPHAFKKVFTGSG